MILFIFQILFSFIEARETIIYLQPSDIISLDPGEATDFYSAEVISNIFEGLVKFKENTLQIEPCLAVSWDIKEKGKKWVFYLRRGVKFHNGEKFDSKAVIQSFATRMQKEDKRYIKWNFFYSFISGVKSLGDYTVEFTLKKSYFPFLTILAETTNYIISPGSYQKKYFKPIGTGPFKFSQRIDEKSLSIEKNPDYWSEKAKISRVIFKVVKDPAWGILQMKNKNADIISIRSAKEYDELIGKKEVKFISRPSLSIHYLAFNTREKPFDSREVRQAIAHLLNKKGLVTFIFRNLAINATTPLPPHIFGFNKKIKDYDFDIKKATGLLEKAGYRKGFVSTLYFSGEPNFLVELTNNIIQNTKIIDITINKKEFPFSELIKMANRGDHQLLILGWAAGPDPDLFLSPQFTMKKGNFNRSFYENPQLTRILEKARETFSLPEREKLYFEAQEIIHRDVPWIPLFHLCITKAYNHKIADLKMNRLGFLILKDLYFEE